MSWIRCIKYTIF